MSNDVWSKPPRKLTDPCVRRCGISSELGYCRGCFMTLDEMSRWYRPDCDDGDKLEILEAIDERKKKANEIQSGK